MSAQRNGPTTIETALALLTQAETEMQSARALIQEQATKENKLQAYRLLSGVQSKCEVLKIAIDPW